MKEVKIEQKDGYVVINCETPTHTDRIAFHTSKDITQLRDACNEFLDHNEDNLEKDNHIVEPKKKVKPEEVVKSCVTCSCNFSNSSPRCLSCGKDFKNWKPQQQEEVHVQKSEESIHEERSTKDFCMDEFVKSDHVPDVGKKEEKPKKLKYVYICKQCNDMSCKLTMSGCVDIEYCPIQGEANWKLKVVK